MLNPWYVTGFVEGEGTFTYSRAHQHLGLYFAVKLTRDDEPLLQELRAFFGCGYIYDVKPRAPGPRSGATNPASYFRVTKLRDLSRVTEHFDAFPLRGRKADQYGVWSRMLQLKLEYFRKKPPPELDLLAQELSALTAKGNHRG